MLGLAKDENRRRVGRPLANSEAKRARKQKAANFREAKVRTERTSTQAHKHTVHTAHTQLSTAKCTYHERCGHDHSDYSPALIMKLRLYISKLPKADARLFVAPGERCTLNEDLLATTLADTHKSLSNKKLHVDWRLEKPDILEARLNAALLADKGRLQHPVRSDCQESCQDFVCFAIGKSKTWFNQPKKNNASRTSPMEEKTDRVFNVNAEYAMEADRPALKARLVKDWLEQQRQEHLVMPNAEYRAPSSRTRPNGRRTAVSCSTQNRKCAPTGARLEGTWCHTTEVPPRKTRHRRTGATLAGGVMM